MTPKPFVELEPHVFQPDVTPEGVGFVFNATGGYVPCAVEGCERDEQNGIHIEVEYINVYIVERIYGGPEEGGWWYDVGTPEGISVKCINSLDREIEAIHKALQEMYPNSGHRYSMNPPGDDYIVRREKHEAKEWPETTPHYE